VAVLGKRRDHFLNRLKKFAGALRSDDVAQVHPNARFDKHAVGCRRGLDSDLTALVDARATPKGPEKSDCKRPAVTADYQLALLAQFQGSNSSILLIG
jgi:hypothetical protein